MGHHKWSDLKHGKVRRRVYAKLCFKHVIHGDFNSIPFYLKRIIVGDTHGGKGN